MSEEKKTLETLALSDRPICDAFDPSPDPTGVWAVREDYRPCKRCLWSRRAHTITVTLDPRGSITFGPVTVFDDGEIRASATVSPSEIVGLVTAAISEGLKANKITLACSCPVESDALGFVRGVRQNWECEVHGATPHPAVKALRAAEAIARTDLSPSR